MENDDPSSVKPNKMPINQIHIFIKKIHVYAHSAVVLFLMYRLQGRPWVFRGPEQNQNLGAPYIHMLKHLYV